MVRELGFEISAWLRKLGLEQYEQVFIDNAIEPDLLAQLTAEDLKELGIIPIGHRRRLLDAIAALQESQTQLLASTSNKSPPPSSPTAMDAERRQVAILFADLVGFTALGNRLDAEEIHALLQKYFEVVDALLANTEDISTSILVIA